jgi:hypothetical protein
MVTAMRHGAAWMLLAVIYGAHGAEPSPANTQIAPRITVSVSPSVATVRAGGSPQAFTATVLDTATTSVEWQVNDKKGGYDQVGRISTGGIYTSPAKPVSPVIVTAVSHGDPRQPASGSAAVIIEPAVSLPRTLSLAVLLSVIYWLVMVLVRWHRIARPTREQLRAQIDGLETELELLDQTQGRAKVTTLLSSGTSVFEVDTEVDVPDPNRRHASIKGLLSSAGRLVPTEGVPLLKYVADAVFWSRGKELTGWLYAHQAESQMTQFLAKPTVVARLESHEEKLRLAADEESVALASTIRQALTPTQAEPERLRALLTEASALTYQNEDEKFSQLANWQNKADWLVVVGLLLIVVLVGWDPVHSLFLLLGAVGGLLSRLSRSLRSGDFPTDYGADWTTFFMSPVAGALGAWALILVGGLAAQLGILGSIFGPAWSEPGSSITLGMAVVFGFSEQLLDTVFNRVAEQSTQTATPTAKRPATPAPTTSQSTPSGGAGVRVAEALPDAVAGQPYMGKPATAGDAGFIWSLEDGELPSGLKLEPSGAVTGIPAASAARRAFAFTARGTPAGTGTEQTRHLTIRVNPAPG